MSFLCKLTLGKSHEFNYVLKYPFIFKFLLMDFDRWWEKAKLLQFVDSQEELDRYNKYLTKELQSKWIEDFWNFRKLVFLTRWYITYFSL